MPMPLPASWASNDPGDRHVGLALWSGSHCMWADEFDPDGFYAKLEELTGLHTGVRLIEVFVQEKFALYGWNERSMAGNEFLTSQMIGVSKYICRRAGVKYVGQFAKQGKQTYTREPFKQWVAKDWRVHGARQVNSHVRDAMAHGYHFIYMRDHER